MTTLLLMLLIVNCLTMILIGQQTDKIIKLLSNETSENDTPKETKTK